MEPEMFVTQISFGDDVIVVNYGEARKQSKVAGVVESLSIDADAVAEEFEELQMLAMDLIDKGLLLIRDPPKRVRPGRKALRRMDELLGDDDDDEVEDLDE